MSKRSRNPVQIDIGARAEAKLSVKAEVPSTSIGRLVDSLTDIIRPFTEARGLRADLLRLHREEVAIEIARRAHARIQIEKGNAQAVPLKLLVPLFEKGSCEDIRDVVMIDRWANLLASASLKLSVQPRFVSILEELSGSQADCLDHVAFHDFEKFEFPYRDVVDAPYEYAEYNIKDALRTIVQSNLKSKKDIEKTLDAIIEFLTSPGVFIELIIVHERTEGGASADYDCVAQTGIRREDDLSILESLGLIRRVVLSIDVKRQRNPSLEAAIFYYHLTSLGVSFCEVCSHPTLLKLEQIDKRNRPKPEARE